MSRVYKRSDGSWAIDFKDADGRRIRRKVGPNRRVAQEVLDNYLGKVARRVHLGVIEDSAIDFIGFAKIWQERVGPTVKPRTAERWFGIVDKHLKPAFRGALRAITSAAIEKYMSGRLEAGANPATVNREFTVIRHMLKRAAAWEFLSANPAAGIKSLRESQGRTRFLTLEEIERLLAACERAQLGHYLKAFAVLALNSGMRRNEILGLTRRAVD